jgi:hypothetical protein
VGRPNALRIEKTPQGRLRVTVVSDSERDISAVVDAEDFYQSYKEAMSEGEGPIIHGEHEEEVEA